MTDTIIPVHPEDPTLKFPLVKDELEPPEQMIRKLFNEFFTGGQEYDSEKCILTRKYEDSWKIDSLSCHYTEIIRIYCLSNKKPTLVQVWKATSPDILRKFKTAYEAREYLLYTLGAGECNPFSPALCLQLYLGFNDSRYPVKILDPSAGWGDRMIAAIAAGDFVSQYDGYDPNKELIEPYQRIMSELDHTKKCRFFCQGFETAEIPKEYYDLGVTSPPYFDLEIYSTDSTQSVSEGKTDYFSWLDKFYKPFLKNLAYGVRSGGKIIIYVSDYTTPNKQKIDLKGKTISILEKDVGGCKLIKEGGLRSDFRKPIRPFLVFAKH